MAVLVLLTPEFCADFEKVLNARFRMSPNEVFQNCMDILWKHKVCYKSDVLKCTLFLTHMVNRGGLMLSPHRAHQNGLKIHKAGADKTQLVNAYAIELAPSGQHRILNIQKNADLIHRSHELLAQINGSERYLTLGCGHTTALCKAVHEKCRTSQKELADREGNLDQSKICRNPQMHSMVNEGWCWTIIPSVVDIKYPAFARCAQKALNIANHVCCEVGDIECGCTMSEYMADPAIMQSADWEEQILESVADQGVPCESWAKDILKFVQTYGGGDNAPCIRFLDDVSKQFQCNSSLGPVIWNALVSVEFYDKTKLYALTRTAIALVALSAEKDQASPFPTIIGKSDVAKLASKGSETFAKDMESTLEDAVAIATVCSSDESISPFKAFAQELGQLFVRVGALATTKQKQSIEGVVYTLKEIKDSFLQAMAKRMNKPIKFEKWGNSTITAVKEEPKAPSLDGSIPSSVSLADHQSHVFVAKRKGFEVGCLVVEKNVDQTAHIGRAFKVNSIAEKVELTQASPWLQNSFTTSIAFEEFLKGWSVTKLELPVKLPFQQKTAFALEIDKVKSELFRAILDSEAVNMDTRSIAFWRKPDHVRVTKEMKQGALQLSPICPLSNITTKSSSLSFSIGKHLVGGEDVEFYVIPMSKPSPDKDGKYDDNASFQAFWWLSGTSDRAKVNMVLETKQVRGFDVPVYRNSVALKPDSELYKFTPSTTRPSIVSKAGAKKKARVV